MTSTQLTIQDVEDVHVPDIIAVWAASGILRPWNDPHLDLSFARRSEQSTVLVGLLEGRVVATAMVGEDGHRGWVYYLATHPDVQRRGFARAMMGAAEAWLRARGVWKMQLLIRADNAEARGFYERIGFRDTQAVCYQKVISGDAATGDAR